MYLSKVLIIIVLMLIVTFGFGENSQANTGVLENEYAIDFVIDMVDGEEIALSDLQGKPVFLNFWASWCVICIREMPIIEEFYQEQDQIQVLAVTGGEKKEDVADLFEKNGYEFPVGLLDAGVFREYLIRFLPTTLLIDKDGKILKRHIGPVNEQLLEEWLTEVSDDDR